MFKQTSAGAQKSYFFPQVAFEFVTQNPCKETVAFEMEALQREVVSLRAWVSSQQEGKCAKKELGSGPGSARI